jgi:hypothetical protein
MATAFSAYMAWKISVTIQRSLDIRSTEGMLNLRSHEKTLSILFRPSSTLSTWRLCSAPALSGFAVCGLQE